MIDTIYNQYSIEFTDLVVKFESNAYEYREDHGTVRNIMLLLSNPFSQSLDVVVEGGKISYYTLF